MPPAKRAEGGKCVAPARDRFATSACRAILTAVITLMQPVDRV